MKIRRSFEKIYNRELPLFSIEYWHQGEYYGLPKITKKSIYYNPLFVYQKNKATDIYYDVTNYEEDDNKLIFSYFRKHPDKFKKIANQYKKECQELLRLTKQAKPEDFSKIFNLHLNYWPKFTAIISLGEVAEQKLNQITREAYQLRKKTDKIEYISGNNLIKLAKQLLPDYKKFINFLTYKEIANKDIPSKKELLKRRNKFIYFEGKLYPGLSINQFKKTANIEIWKDGRNEIPKHILEGVTAAKGRVIGRVKVILELEKLNQVKKGDILVTSMTTPDYLIAMTKAAAFITDEGGITCHAAIIAREIGKPCLIGTKVATRFLRDGDLVEVDANQGIVKIIKRK